MSGVLAVVVLRMLDEIGYHLSDKRSADHLRTVRRVGVSSASWQLRQLVLQHSQDPLMLLLVALKRGELAAPPPEAALLQHRLLVLEVPEELGEHRLQRGPRPVLGQRVDELHALLVLRVHGRDPHRAHVLDVQTMLLLVPALLAVLLLCGVGSGAWLAGPLGVVRPCNWRGRRRCGRRRALCRGKRASGAHVVAAAAGRLAVLLRLVARDGDRLRGVVALLRDAHLHDALGAHLQPLACLEDVDGDAAGRAVGEGEARRLLAGEGGAAGGGEACDGDYLAGAHLRGGLPRHQCVHQRPHVRECQIPYLQVGRSFVGHESAFLVEHDEPIASELSTLGH
mmetsp:Transcript_27373/g.59812  ORF Transcript_27373/g.59812 Transcript_27373/m.59812 type:complete len:339 (-) Transcript_27373:410-1426(-)